MTMVVRVNATKIPCEADPLSVFEGLTDCGPDTVLLESRDGDGKNNVRSMLFVDCCLRMEGRGNTVDLIPLSKEGHRAAELVAGQMIGGAEVRSAENKTTITFGAANLDEGDDEKRILAPGPLDVLRVMSIGWNVECADEETTLAVPGVFSYDLVENFERLPEAAGPGHDFPDTVHWLPGKVVVIDHGTRAATVQSMAYGSKECPPEHGDGGLLQLVERTEAVIAGLPRRSDNDGRVRIGNGSPSSPDGCRADMDDQTYCEVVEALKKHIISGDVFQIVPSRTFSVECPNPTLAYDVLRRINPSPYQFLLIHPRFTLFGSSPETCVRVSPGGEKVEICPIAGTRPRGLGRDGLPDPELDTRMEADLRLNDKETAEHMMLVDLARNDVARICIPGTRRVSRLLAVERYSHVMHLVSSVTGTLNPRLDALHAYRASANMGTLVGAPKIRASILLRKYEIDRRGPYGGAVGYLESNGRMDTAIVIRSALVVGGVAHVRAGAGVVFDSVPAAEADETRAKAAAVLRAIAIAGEASR